MNVTKILSSRTGLANINANINAIDCISPVRAECVGAGVGAEDLGSRWAPEGR